MKKSKANILPPLKNACNMSLLPIRIPLCWRVNNSLMLVKRIWPNCETGAESNSGYWIFGYLCFAFLFLFFYWAAVKYIILLFVASRGKKILNRHWPPEDNSDSNKCIFPCIFSCLCPQNCEWNMVLGRRNFRLWLSKRAFLFWLSPALIAPQNTLSEAVCPAWQRVDQAWFRSQLLFVKVTAPGVFARI